MSSYDRGIKAEVHDIVFLPYGRICESIRDLSFYLTVLVISAIHLEAEETIV